MLKTVRYAIFTLVLCGHLSATPVAAAESAAISTNIAPDKLKAIQELLVASRTTRNAKMGFDLVFGQEIKGLSAGLSDRIDRNPMLTAAQKTEAKQIMSDSLNRRRDRFTQLIGEKLKLDSAIEEVFMPLFDKHFTLTEINEMLAYYNSPIGQKSLDLLPAMSSEAALTLNVRLLPKLREISAQVDEEERNAAHDAIQKKTTAPDKPAGGKDTDSSK